MKQKKDAPKKSWKRSLIKAGKNVGNAIPIIIGVLLLFGLFRTFVPTSAIRQVFSGNPFKDTFIGAVLGSIFAGNAVNSYIIGGELLRNGVSLFAVAAFVITWVTVGFIQLPAEASLLGKSFALKRNALSFVLSFFVAIATVLTLNLLG
jgi:uncharacterized membrane protein YraQ (UPF0718 family)